MNNKITARILFTGALVSLMFLAIGCEQLNFKNPNAPTVDVAPIQTLITGVEAGSRADLDIYLRVVSVLGREAYYFEPADPRYTGELLFGNPDPGGFLLTRPWSARYRVVADTRFLIEKATALSGAPKAGVDGFAKTMMAYELLLNLNYLDENGIKLDFSGDLSVPFASKAESFTFIQNLLDEANSELGQAGGSFIFQLSPGFAGFDTPAGFAQFNRALRARVAIYQKKYQDALTALGASFLDTGGDLTLGVYHVYSNGLGDQQNGIFETPDAPFVKLMAHPTFLSEAEANDPRVSSKTVVRSTATTFDNLTSNLGVTLVSSSTAPLPIIRNEELILLRAEANIGLGQLGPAESDINLIRSRYGLSPVTLTANNALDQLLHEKRYSLFLEGYRWIDMRRYGRLNQLPIDRSTDTVLDKMPRPETEILGG